MGLPALVLVHGGAHAADCWHLTLNEIQRQEPELDVLAVDLPGRRDKGGDLATLTISDFVDSVVDDIEQAGLVDVVIVGHSMAGVTVPGVVSKLGSPRVRELIFATAFVPPEGSAIVDTLSGPLARFTRRNAGKGAPATLPAPMARFAFYNTMSRTERKFMSDKLYPEAVHIVTEKVSRRDLPDVPRTWILTQRDRALSVKSQRRSIEAIGGVQTVIPIDTCHDLMVSEPERLAEILVERCRLRAQ